MFSQFLLYLSIFGSIYPESNSQKRIIREWVSKNRAGARKYQAWKELFGGLNLEGIVNEINSIYIDPDYQIAVELVLIKRKVRVVEKSIRIKRVTVN